MLIFQYLIQFSGPRTRARAQHRFAQTNDGSTNITRVHAFYALLLPSKNQARRFEGTNTTP